MPTRRTSRTMAGLLAINSLAMAGPCDIYASGGTPCVAAHGMTRALYNSYNGPLYQVVRGSDSKTTDVSTKNTGGVANAATQNSFCANTTCAVSIIYDQSGKANHLTLPQPPYGGSQGTQPNKLDDQAAAIGAPVSVNGQNVFGLFVSPGVGLRNDAANGLPTGNQPGGVYGVFDGTHYNDRCCFDYGFTETKNYAGKDGTMFSLYFGGGAGYASGAGNPPWLMVDMENGLYTGQSGGNNKNDPSISDRFTVGYLKGDSSNLWALRGASASSNSASNYYSGQYPNGYYPMQKESAIVLGSGGDNGNEDQGTWYEGALLSGYPSDATENAVQANIAAAKYATTSMATGPAIKVGSTITLRATTPGFTNRYLAHSGRTVNTQVITSSSSPSTQTTAQWKVTNPLAPYAGTGCISFESVDTSGSYIRHSSFELYVDSSDGSTQFNEDATFCPQMAFTGAGTNSIHSWSYPNRWLRHYDNTGYVARNGNSNNNFDGSSSFNEDASWVVSDGFLH